MKALLKFNNGDHGIAQVHSSEDAAGNIYVTEQLTHVDGWGRAVDFRFVQIQILRGCPVAHYQEILRIDVLAVSNAMR